MNYSAPTPGPDLYSPRLIRVVQGIQHCPRCSHKVFQTVQQAGWGFQTCEKQRCSQEWWSLALPPDAPAGHLAMLCGEDAARILMLRAFPHSASLEPPDLWGYPLNATDEQAWIQVAVRPRERHLHRRSRITQLIHAFVL